MDTQVRLGKVRLGKDSIDNISAPAPKKQKHKYGEYKNVLLTDDDLEKLKAAFPSDWESRIQNLSEGIELKGYSYKNHYLAIVKWSKRETEKVKSGKVKPDYTDTSRYENIKGWD